jgi:hypothetical protein
VHLHLSVDDADAFHALLHRRGIAPANATEDEPCGREFDVVDPDGYRIEILQPARRSGRLERPARTRIARVSPGPRPTRETERLRESLARGPTPGEGPPIPSAAPRPLC